MNNEMSRPLHLIRCNIRLFDDSNEEIGVLENKVIATWCRATYGVDLLSQLSNTDSRVASFKIDSQKDAGSIKTRTEYLSRLGEIDFIATLSPNQVIDEWCSNAVARV